MNREIVQITSDRVLSTAFPSGTDLFVPLKVTPDITEGVTVTPRGYVTVRYMGPIGLRSVHVRWVRSLTVSTLLYKAKKEDVLFKQFPVLKCSKFLNGKRVKIRHPVRVGDVLELNLVFNSMG